MQFENEFKNIDAQASGLLGDYDSSGTYLIDAKILDELKKTLKIITSYTEWQIKANASVGGNKLDFDIIIEDGEQNLKRATLYLLEKANLGYIDKQIKTKVAEEILVNDNSFFENIKKAFNLIIAEESDGKDIDNKTFINIINKKKDKKSKYTSLIEPSIQLDKDYVALMLEFLSKNKNCKSLILEFKNELREKKLSKIDVAYYRKAKIILDKLVNKSYEKFDQDQVKKIEKIREQFFKEFSKVAPYKPVKLRKEKGIEYSNGSLNTKSNYSSSKTTSATGNFFGIDDLYKNLASSNCIEQKAKAPAKTKAKEKKPVLLDDKFYGHKTLDGRSVIQKIGKSSNALNTEIKIKSENEGEDITL